jgi:hypothetical protein
MPARQLFVLLTNSEQSASEKLIQTVAL